LSKLLRPSPLETLTAAFDLRSSPLLDWLNRVFDYDGTPAQAYYALRFLCISVDDLEERSIFRKAALGRYGRQSVLQWADVPVPMIEKYYRAMADLIRRENELSRMSEDG